MTATNHALTGAVIAIATKRPELAIPTAFLSHFLVDMIPHFKLNGSVTERHQKKIFWVTQLSDLVLAAVLLVFVPLALKSSVSQWLVFWSMLAAILPDFMWVYRLIGEVRTKIYKPGGRFVKFHIKIQWSETQGGIFVEAFWFVLMWGLMLAGR